jgi:quinol monooxygenase YgiN
MFTKALQHFCKFGQFVSQRFSLSNLSTFLTCSTILQHDGGYNRSEQEFKGGIIMVLTVLEAQVPENQWEALRSAYEGPITASLPPQLVQSFLLQSESDPTLWWATSVWKSRAALEEYRNSVETPGGVLLFRSVGAEPTLSIYNIAAHVANETALLETT